MSLNDCRTLSGRLIPDMCSACQRPSCHTVYAFFTPRRCPDGGGPRVWIAPRSSPAGRKPPCFRHPFDSLLRVQRGCGGEGDRPASGGEDGSAVPDLSLSLSLSPGCVAQWLNCWLRAVEVPGSIPGGCFQEHPVGPHDLWNKLHRDHEMSASWPGRVWEQEGRS